jgi:hypothetical protein
MDRQKKIAELRAEIAKLEAEEKRLAELPEDRRLAEAMHSMLCRTNHTDGCSWEYEHDLRSTWPDMWTGQTHLHWLGRAHEVMTALPGKDIDDIIEITRIIRGY